jgi:hypothetical protein
MDFEVQSRDVELFSRYRANEALVSGVQIDGIRSSTHLEEGIYRVRLTHM